MIASQNLEFPRIATLPEEIERPFWSVMITTYNRTEYLKQALESILAQDIRDNEMQIEVVDDCSTQGNIEKIVKEIGNGRVSFYRQPQNVGIYANWNTCINRARGRWIHILSDDDLVMVDFYKAYRRHIESYECSMLIGQSVFLDEKDRWVGVSQPLDNFDGLLDNPLWTLSKNNPIRTPGVVVTREAYEKVGGFTTSLVFATDWEMWTRLASSVKVAYINRPYSCFRVHSDSETDKLIRTGVSITDTLAASKSVQSRFSDLKQRKNLQFCIHDWLSKTSFGVSRKMLAKGYYGAALKQALWALRLTPSFFYLIFLAWVFLRSFIGFFLKKRRNN